MPASFPLFTPREWTTANYTNLFGEIFLRVAIFTTYARSIFTTHNREKGSFYIWMGVPISLVPYRLQELKSGSETPTYIDKWEHCDSHGQSNEMSVMTNIHSINSVLLQHGFNPHFCVDQDVKQRSRCEECGTWHLALITSTARLSHFCSRYL